VQPLRALVEGIADDVIGRDADVDAMTLDINAVREGTLFCARRAWWGDTHAQLGRAVSQGAAALLVSRPDAIPPSCPVPVVVSHAEDPALGLIAARLYDDPTRRLKVYGVTGTNGKTTTTWMLRHILASRGERPAIMGTLGYDFEDAHVPASNTTPDALVIQRFAADARARGATALVLEVSSHALAIGRVAGVLFDSVGFTQLGRDHLDFHKDQAKYVAAKARLFGEHLRRAIAAEKSVGASAVIDDVHGAYMLDCAPGAALRRGLTVGSKRADRQRWAVSLDRALGLEGNSIRLHTHEGSAAVDLPLLGDFNQANAGLAATMVETTHPEDWSGAWASLADFGGVPGRLERVGARVFVDYAHTPDALIRVTECLRTAGADPLTVVVGCGGDRDPGKRPLMAQAAQAGADRVVLTSDNPRSEDPLAILDAMGTEAEREVDRSRAIQRALAEPGIVLVAGKGHERTQTEAGRRYHFDDRDEARRLQRALAEGVAPDAAPLSWAWPELEDVDRLLLEARARRGGLLLVRARPGQRGELESALTDQLGEHWLGGTSPEVYAQLAPHHRVLLLSGAWPGVEALTVRGVEDVSVALTELTGGAPATPAEPAMPLLDAERS
jgi:UDP-N-acetylmuramoyl-L-alanyl-D-glutamate--2,6-diaminopimelate ligase